MGKWYQRLCSWVGAPQHELPLMNAHELRDIGLSHDAIAEAGERQAASRRSVGQPGIDKSNQPNLPDGPGGSNL
jgi:hypothetical protein